MISGQAANSREYYPEGSNVDIPTFGVWPLLYDLDVDQAEGYNVAKRYPITVEKFDKKINKWSQGFMANPLGWK